MTSSNADLSGLLDVGDGHQIAWEHRGDPQGRPALYLHGGPGGGVSPGERRIFDPTRYRVALLDQRGCGGSRPLASDPDPDLRANTTQHLIADIERLRRHLGVPRWTVVGVSWGSTLALAYAQAHPERVVGLALGLVTTTSRREVAWITEGVGRIFPDAWERFAGAVPPALRDRPLVDAYAELLLHPDPAVHGPAAAAWCAWEDAHVSLSPGHRPSPRYQDPVFRLGFARLVTHYWRNAAFLEEDQLIREAHRLHGIPGVLICGRYDVSGPVESAWRLSRAWTHSRLVVLDDIGHSAGGSFGATLTAAIDEVSGGPAR